MNRRGFAILPQMVGSLRTVLGFAWAFSLGVEYLEVDALANSITTMGPYPEVPDALREIRKNAKLAIFTNSDDDLI